ncbi:MAG: hypothetical protein HW390_30 [Candidatus Brocadiaceae bacterium]|nr:hypothetical protein [Candidatus Brocadiaceae bacterium]
MDAGLIRRAENQPEGWMLLDAYNACIKAGIVSILIQPEGWMLCAIDLASTTYKVFQSSSSPKAGCYELMGFLKELEKVSILIQPEGWMLSLLKYKTNLAFQFQSSSSPKAGCYMRPGELKYPSAVSILIQPEGWMLCFRRC